MIDDIDAYDGVYGLMWHKQKSEDRFIKVGYHEGLWIRKRGLRCRIRNHTIIRYRGRGVNSNRGLSNL